MLWKRLKPKKTLAICLFLDIFNLGNVKFELKDFILGWEGYN